MQYQTRPAVTPPARTGALDVTCVICGRPVPDQAYACPTCAGRLDRALAAVPELVDELETSIARQGRTQAPAARGSAAGLLPFDQAASDAYDRLVNAVATWARHVAYERGLELPEAPLHVDPLIGAAGWLRDQVEWIRHRAEVNEVVDDFAQCVAGARRAIDRPPDRLYVGRCECGTPLYARRGVEEATCRECGAVWGVDEQRQWMILASRDTLASAAAISRALTALGRPVAAGTIRQWGNRRRLTIHGRLVIHPGTLYRVGEVLDLADDELVQQRRNGHVA